MGCSNSSFSDGKLRKVLRARDAELESLRRCLEEVTSKSGRSGLGETSTSARSASGSENSAAASTSSPSSSFKVPGSFKRSNTWQSSSTKRNESDSSSRLSLISLEEADLLGLVASPRMLVTYIRAKQFASGALAAPQEFQEFKEDFTSDGTKQWASLLDTDERVTKKMLERFAEFDSLDLARQEPIPVQEFLGYISSQAMFNRNNLFTRDSPFLIAVKAIPIAVDENYSGHEVRVQKQGKNGSMITEAVEPFNPEKQVVVHRVGDNKNCYPVYKTYLHKNYKQTAIGTWEPDAPPTVFFCVSIEDLVALRTAAMRTSFACNGTTGERVDPGDYIRVHRNPDGSFEFYCVGKDEWEDTYKRTDDQKLGATAKEWFARNYAVTKRRGSWAEKWDGGARVSNPGSFKKEKKKTRSPDGSDGESKGSRGI